MCRLTKCPKCQKNTWVGCGQHIDNLFKNIPKSQACFCDPTKPMPKYFAFL